MDTFKSGEILRMEKGGNSRWREFYSTNQSGGKGWRDLKAENKEDFERVYAGDVAEEWKERLGCEVEGREFEGVVKNASGREKEGERGDGVGGGGGKTQKEANEDFFARKGSENEKRRADLPPSQGGKYAGFGSEPPPTARDTGAGGGKGIPGVDEFQKDPVAALTKGFGWFTTTVGKSAKSVNDGWIQPNMQKVIHHIVFLLFRSTWAYRHRVTLLTSSILYSSPKPISQPKHALPPPKSPRTSRPAAKMQRSSSIALSKTLAPPTLRRQNRKKQLSPNIRISGIPSDRPLLKIVLALLRMRNMRP